MGWETRRGRRYFYRSQRVGKKVNKVYLGCGLEARIAARKAAETKAQRAAARMDVRRMLARLEHADVLLTELNKGVELLTAAEMLSAGFHPHRQEWRRRRNREQEN